MRPSPWIASGLVLVMCAGCFTTSQEKTPPATVRALTPPPAPVTVESITDANYRQMTQRLAEEIRQEGQNEPIARPRE